VPSSRAIFLDARPFHAVSLVLHTTCVLLVWHILRSRIAGGWPAVAGSLIFALHPLQVESVAWISEQRGLLSAAMCLGVLCLSRDTASSPARRISCLARSSPWEFSPNHKRRRNSAAPCDSRGQGGLADDHRRDAERVAAARDRGQ